LEARQKLLKGKSELREAREWLCFSTKEEPRGGLALIDFALGERRELKAVLFTAFKEGKEEGFTLPL